MKNVLLILLALCAFNASAQTSNHIPFPSVDGYWTYRYYGDQGEPGSYTEYYTAEDTLINNALYKKLMTNGSDYAGAYRDSNRVVYFIPDTSIMEFVLYDFNLEVGDTIIHPFGGTVGNDDTVTVWSTDSVLISGNYHKTILFGDFIQWTEGIGSHNYLLNPFLNLTLSGNDILLCMMNDSALIWGASNNFCITSVNETEMPNNAVSIYPNPSNSTFQVQLNTGTIQQIKIMDIAGRVILDNPQVNARQFQVSKLPAGIYLVKLRDHKGRYSVRRIVSTK